MSIAEVLYLASFINTQEQKKRIESCCFSMGEAGATNPYDCIDQSFGRDVKIFLK